MIRNRPNYPTYSPMNQDWDRDSSCVQIEIDIPCRAEKGSQCNKELWSQCARAVFLLQPFAFRCHFLLGLTFFGFSLIFVWFGSQISFSFFAGKLIQTDIVGLAEAGIESQNLLNFFGTKRSQNLHANTCSIPVLIMLQILISLRDHLRACSHCRFCKQCRIPTYREQYTYITREKYLKNIKNVTSEVSITWTLCKEKACRKVSFET